MEELTEKKIDMMINGQKVSVSEKVLKSRMMRDKKVEVEINGKRIRCPEHMLEDIMKFGGSLTRRIVKNPPKEVLLMTEPKTIILPKVEKVIIPSELKPEIKEIPPVGEKEIVKSEYPGDKPIVKKIVKKGIKKTTKK